MRSLSITGLILLSCLLAVAQQQPVPQSDDVLRINTDLVQTYITVIDKQGHFVDGLARERFQLLVDGQPRSISFFERITAGSAREAQLTAGDDPGSGSARTSVTIGGRTIVFFIDDIHLSLESLNRTRQMLRNFLDHEMGPADSVGYRFGQRPDRVPATVHQQPGSSAGGHRAFEPAAFGRAHIRHEQYSDV